jgi:hypothetical protein
VVLVDHDAVEAGAVGLLVLAVVALVEVAGQGGVEVGVGQGEAQGGVLLLQAGVVAGVGLLGEVVVLGAEGRACGYVSPPSFLVTSD